MKLKKWPPIIRIHPPHFGILHWLYYAYKWGLRKLPIIKCISITRRIFLACQGYKLMYLTTDQYGIQEHKIWRFCPEWLLADFHVATIGITEYGCSRLSALVSSRFSSTPSTLYSLFSNASNVGVASLSVPCNTHLFTCSVFFFETALQLSHFSIDLS